MFTKHSWATRLVFIDMDITNPGMYKYRHCLDCGMWQRLVGRKWFFFDRWEDCESPYGNECGEGNL